MTKQRCLWSLDTELLLHCLKMSHDLTFNVQLIFLNGVCDSLFPKPAAPPEHFEKVNTGAVCSGNCKDRAHAPLN